MNNKKILKDLAKRIRILKNARKPSDPNHKHYYEYWTDRYGCTQQLDNLSDLLNALKFEARCRSIIQALRNRKINIKNISDLPELLKDLGIETKLKEGTPNVFTKDLIQFIDQEDKENKTNAA